MIVGEVLVGFKAESYSIYRTILVFFFLRPPWPIVKYLRRLNNIITALWQRMASVFFIDPQTK